MCVPKAAGTGCGDCRECQGTSCVGVCEAGEVCFAGACEDLSGGCTGDADGCAGQNASCSVDGRNGACINLDGGAPFCFSAFECRPADTICETDADCVARGFGDHAQCVTGCGACAEGAAPACVRWAGD